MARVPRVSAPETVTVVKHSMAPSKPNPESKPCLFCEPLPLRVIDENDAAFVIRDAYPVSPGHTLVIPKRHVQSYFELEPAEIVALNALLKAAKSVLDKELNPASYNIGINDGPAAGQTIAHVHVHLIPRYTGDSDDPRGGVRWLLPAKADYWSPSP
jgi:diadenosine tetraphosphate (Ap4A) HIT family hydrolase